MQIRVKCSCGEGKCPEWAIMELQGVVEIQPSFQHLLHNLQIGLLCRPSSQESYTLTVGYHELSGTKLALKKPLLVLKKTKHVCSDEGDNRDIDEDGSEPSTLRTEVEVIGIVRHKILFKNRPKALISGPPQPIAKDK